MYNLKKLKYMILILLAILALPLAASEEDSESGFPFTFDINLGLGFDSFEDDPDGDGTTEPIGYNKLTLGPDFGIGPFGIGFELTFHFIFQNNELTVRQEDWVPEEVTFLNVLELYLSKFRYIRYGHMGDPLYAKFGSIEDGLLGNGFIMGYYANTLFLPEKRVLGLQFNLDGDFFGFPLFGIETFAGNVVKPDVLGARIYFRPLLSLNIPIISVMQTGISVATDINPDAYLEDREINDDVTFYDFDVQLPLISNAIVSLAVFGDMGTYKFKSIGGMLGFGGNLISFFNYGAQMRFIGDGFIPTYFDMTYDITRGADYDNIERTGNNVSPGYMGWLAYIGTGIEGLFNLRISLDGPIGEVEPGALENPANYLHLTGMLTIYENIIPGFSIDGIYDKAFITDATELFSLENAFILGKLNYRMGTAIISLLYQVTYNPDNPEGEELSITSGLETTISF